MNKEILRLAFPNILANLSVPLLSLVDIALMGHLNDEQYIVGIGLGVMIFNFVYWGFGFLRMGVTGMTAQEYGKGNVQESKLLLFRGLFVALLGAVLIFVSQQGILAFSLGLIDGSPLVNSSVSSYFNIRVYAAPATLAIYVFVGWFLGKQQATMAMVVTIMVNLVNVLLSYYLVKVQGMEIEGVAYGTVIAQYVGLLVSVVIYLIYFKKEVVKISLSQVMQIDALKKFMSVNTDIIIRTLCLIFTLSFFKIQSAHQGDLLGAANILLLEFITITAYGIDGFAFAAEAISGKYFGSKNVVLFKKAVRYCFYWGFGISVVYSLLYFFFGENILGLLTDQVNVIEEALVYMNWLILFPVLSVAAFVWDGIFIGATATKAMRNTMLFATFFLFLPAYYLLTPLMSNHGLWLAFMLFIVGRGLGQTVIAKRVVFDKL
ncbi:MATE family efflux transporter [bacterium]|nr:MATE family efflux transporter [bacterium]